MTTKIVFAAGALVLASTVGYAQNAARDIDDSAYLYHQQCRASAIGQETNPATNSMCLYFSMGLQNGLTVANGTAYQSTKHYLYTPQPVTYGQFAVIGIKYMENHPKELNRHTTEVFVDAMMDAYPAK